jgi:hypothetical protein
MSQTTLTGADATLWQAQSATPTTGSTYSMVVQYSIGASSGDTTTVTSTQDIGVVCLITTENFTLADGDTAAGFSLQTLSTGVATIAASTNWGVMLVYSLTAVTHTTDVQLVTGSTGTACTTSNVIPMVISDEKAWWFFDIADACTSLPLSTATWYARCFHKAAATDLASETGKTLVVSAAKNVTGAALTFATGATVLAGVAYLQF